MSNIEARDVLGIAKSAERGGYQSIPDELSRRSHIVKFLPTALDGVLIIEPDVLRDERGFFLETFHASRYTAGGITAPFVQDNHSRSSRGTIRGLHAQEKHAQGKLVRAIAGEIFDVVADIRRNSQTYLQWLSFELSARNFRQIYVPPGYAHGICILSEYAEIEYKCTDFYSPDDEIRIAWNDPELAVAWPIDQPILSTGDRLAKSIAELQDRLPLLQTQAQ